MIIDISQEIFSGRVYPGDTAPTAVSRCSIADGGACNLTDITMCVHNATHIDAPRHFFDNGASIDALAPEAFVGDALVVSAASGEVTGEEMRRFLEKNPRRLLIKGNAYLTDEAAREAVGHGLLLVGTELQSIGKQEAPKSVHLILLDNSVLILEGIVLRDVPEGEYTLCALPLKLGGLDGSPCRAVLITK